jgi:hypothetical protein
VIGFYFQIGMDTEEYEKEQINRIKEKTASRNRKISIQWENIAKKQSIVDPIENTNSLLEYIRSNVIGDNEIYPGPYGYRKITYCDYIASGRSLKFIEDYIRFFL